MIDIVFCKDCLNLGKKLGYDKLIVIDASKTKINTKKNNTDKIVAEDKFRQVNNPAKNITNKSIIYASNRPKKNILSVVKAEDVRAQIINKNIDIIYGLEGTRDFIHHRNSGLNQVLLNLAKENDKIIAFSLKDILNPGKLGRIRQNIRLCNKYGVKMMFASFAKNKFEMRNPKDMLAILKTIGMDPKHAKKAMSLF